MTPKELFDKIHELEAEYFMKRYSMGYFITTREEIIKLLTEESNQVQAQEKKCKTCTQCTLYDDKQEFYFYCESHGEDFNISLIDILTCSEYEPKLNQSLTTPVKPESIKC